MTKINVAVRTEITQSIKEFEKELSETGLQHTSTEAFAEIVRDYASALIDQSIRNAPEETISYEIGEQDLMSLEKMHARAGELKYEFWFAAHVYVTLSMILTKLPSILRKAE